MPSAIGSGGSNWPMAARCFSMRLGRSPSISRASSCACYRNASSNASARRRRGRSTSASCRHNRDLGAEVRRGAFAKICSFRLNVFPIQVRPLRERPEDIAPIAQHFLQAAARRLRVAEPRLTEGDVRRLCRYPWPGKRARVVRMPSSGL